jgi:hypothetical protein
MKKITLKQLFLQARCLERGKKKIILTMFPPWSNFLRKRGVTCPEEQLLE